MRSPLFNVAVPMTPQQKTLHRITRINTSTLLALIAGFNQGMNVIWNDPEGLSPQQSVDSLGTGATTQLSIAQATAGFITQIAGILGMTLGTDAPALQQPPAGYSIQPNQDGTATVIAPPTGS